MHIQVYEGTGVRVYGCAGAQVCGCTGVRVYRCAGVQVCGCTGRCVCTHEVGRLWLVGGHIAARWAGDVRCWLRSVWIGGFAHMWHVRARGDRWSTVVGDGVQRYDGIM